MLAIRFTVITIALGCWYATAIPFPNQVSDIPAAQKQTLDQGTTTLSTPSLHRRTGISDSLNELLQQKLLSLQQVLQQLQSMNISHEKRIQKQQEIQNLQQEIQGLQGKLLEVKQAEQNHSYTNRVSHYV